MTTEKKDVNIMSLKEPRFLSVVKKPANRISFRIVRSEDGEERKEFEALEKRRDQKIKVKRNEKLISISFPSTLDEEELETMRNHYGLTSDSYSMDDGDGSSVTFTRNGDAPEATAKVSMPDGAVAEIEVPITVRSADQGDRYLSLVALRFDKSDYEAIDAIEHLMRGYEIDFTSDNLTETDTHFVYTRQDTEDEMIEVTLKEGFTAVVTRAATDDVPASLSLGINSSAYGSYGWGQLNFASAMADIEYTRILDNSLYVLNNVLENILFWSDMSLGDRKVLVKASLDSYGEFVSNLMDALPVQPDTQRSENVQLENDMTTQAQTKPGSEVTEQDTSDSTDTDVTRTEEITEDKTTADSTENTNEFITRTEFTEGLSTMEANIIAALKPAEAAPAVEVTKDVTETRSEETVPASKTDPVMDMLTKISEQQDTLATRMDKVEDTSNATVIVRTEDADDDADTTETRSDETGNVFSGIFSRRA